MNREKREKAIVEKKEKIRSLLKELRLLIRQKEKNYCKICSDELLIGTSMSTLNLTEFCFVCQKVITSLADFLAYPEKAQHFDRVMEISKRESIKLF